MRFFQQLILLSCLLPAFSYAGWFSEKKVDWHIDTDHSELAFSSLKKQNVFETHQFSRFFGVLTPEGELTINIDLNSAKTGIPIRDERLASMLFKTAQHPEAVFSAQLPEKLLPQNIKTEQAKTFEIKGHLSLHGKKQPVTLKIKAIKLNKKRIAINTTEPIVINAAQFDLVSGIEALREIAGLPSINLIVPVSFSVELVRE